MVAEGNVGVAFALVIGAGLCTTIGAGAAFFARLASPKMLALGLGLSAGVMIYVSFVEIFMQKGVSSLEEGGWGENGSYRWGTLLLFAGMIITALLDVIVHFISKLAGVNQDITEEAVVKDASDHKTITAKVADNALPKVLGESLVMVDLEDGTTNDAKKANEEDNDSMDYDKPVHLTHVPEDMPEDAAKAVDTYVTNDHHRFGLQKMGLLTALAIGIHNLPEGLATFIAALSDPLNGVAIAVAIALHNIPEGVCVAMPVYYATGSRMKGFFWAFLSGLSEPLGGLLGYAFLHGERMTDVAYGLLFCLVAGMMIYISIVELIPTAMKYDPHNHVTTKGVIAGMVIMAASLLAFTF